MFQEEICLRREVSSLVSLVPGRDVPTAMTPPGVQPLSSASPHRQLLCELLGSLLLWKSLGQCSEETARSILQTWVLWPAPPQQPRERKGCFILPSGLLLVQLDAVYSRMNVMQGLSFFFFNLRQLVKTLKQWIDAHWKLFSSCLRSQEQLSDVTSRMCL